MTTTHYQETQIIKHTLSRLSMMYKYASVATFAALYGPATALPYFQVFTTYNRNTARLMDSLVDQEKRIMVEFLASDYWLHGDGTLYTDHDDHVTSFPI